MSVGLFILLRQHVTNKYNSLLRFIIQLMLRIAINNFQFLLFKIKPGDDPRKHSANLARYAACGFFVTRNINHLIEPGRYDAPVKMIFRR